MKSETELMAKQREYDAMIADLSKVTEETKLTQTRLTTLETEIAGTRLKLRDTEADLDDKFGQVVKLTDELNQANGLQISLKERNTQLAFQVTQMKLVMNAHGLDVNSLVRHIVLPVTGIVLAVNSTDLVEISIGSDDGLKSGHLLQVYRGNTYLGQITIRQTGPDRAVGQIDKKLQRGQIRKGDNVTAKLS